MYTINFLGFPLIGVIVVLVVNKRGFDGILDRDCIFRQVSTSVRSIPVLYWTISRVISAYLVCGHDDQSTLFKLVLANCVIYYNNRCRLEERVLYFAYLLPMSAILLHNTAIFILVLKVLLRHGKARSTGKLAPLCLVTNDVTFKTRRK